MTLCASASWLSIAPQGNVMQLSHGHVPNRAVEAQGDQTF